VLVGPLPQEIQNYTTYAAGVGASARHPEAAKALIRAFVDPKNADLIRSKGLEPVAA
jgi:molybdate transport system substrate-binding protein